MMNNSVVKSKLINAAFTLDVIDLKFGDSIAKLEKFSFSKVVKALTFGFTIVKRMIRFKPSLVYFTLAPTGFAFYRDAFYVLLLRAFPAKIILHLHGKGIDRNAAGSGMKRWLYKTTFRNTHVICLSQTLSADIANVYKPAPFIVNNGVASTPQEAAAASGNGAPRILYLSNYIRNKGILVLVEALGMLRKRGCSFTAQFVGAPSNVSVAMLEEELATRHLTGLVDIAGPRHGEEKTAAFREADIFVFPTYNDSFPLVTLEAMQFRLPVVSTFEGSIPDIVMDGTTGFLVNKQDATMLADKIEILLRDKALRERMGASGYQRFQDNYTLGHFESGIYETFQKVMKAS